MSIVCILAIAALVLTLVSASGHAPLWPAVFLIAVIELIHCMPLR